MNNFVKMLLAVLVNAGIGAAEIQLGPGSGAEKKDAVLKYALQNLKLYVALGLIPAVPEGELSQTAGYLIDQHVASANDAGLFTKPVARKKTGSDK